MIDWQKRNGDNKHRYNQAQPLTQNVELGAHLLAAVTCLTLNSVLLSLCTVFIDIPHIESIGSSEPCIYGYWIFWDCSGKLSAHPCASPNILFAQYSPAYAYVCPGGRVHCRHSLFKHLSIEVYIAALGMTTFPFDSPWWQLCLLISSLSWAESSARLLCLPVHFPYSTSSNYQHSSRFYVLVN